MQLRDRQRRDSHATLIPEPSMASDPILDALDLARRLRVKPHERTLSQRDVQAYGSLEQLAEIFQVLLPSRAPSGSNSLDRTFKFVSSPATPTQSVVTKAALLYLSDWAMVETTTPDTTFCKDPRQDPSVYQSVEFTSISVRWDGLGTFQSGRIPLVGHSCSMFPDI